MKSIRTAHFVALTPIILAAVGSPLEAQSSQVLPLDRRNLEGSGSTVYPLGRANSQFQQLFADLGAARTLRGHAYRRDAIADRGKIATFQSSLEISLSETTVAPDKASTTFANNRGGKLNTVLPRTTISFPETDRPRVDPSSTFALRIPYKQPFVWRGQGSLNTEITVHGNRTASGTDRNFFPYIDAHELFTSGLAVQPGFVYAAGCAVPGARNAARARFETRRLGSGNLDIDLTVDRGLPTNSQGTSVAVLAVGVTTLSVPTVRNCRFHTRHDFTVALNGQLDATGKWSGRIKAGKVPDAVHLYAQVGMLRATTGLADMVLTDASRLTASPKGPGLVGVRFAHATNRASATGSRSFVVPVTEFY